MRACDAANTSPDRCRYLGQTPHVVRPRCARPSVYDKTTRPTRNRCGRAGQPDAASRRRRAIRRIRNHGPPVFERALPGHAPIPRDDFLAALRVGVAPRPVLQLDVLRDDTRTAELRALL